MKNVADRALVLVLGVRLAMKGVGWAVVKCNKL